MNGRHPGVASERNASIEYVSTQQRGVTFSGNVQGVGFRYAACMIARSFDITGYIQNAPDGTVDAVLEGPAGEIDGFLEEINDQMRGYIRRIQQDIRRATGEFHEFGVRD